MTVSSYSELACCAFSLSLIRGIDSILVTMAKHRSNLDKPWLNPQISCHYNVQYLTTE